MHKRVQDWDRLVLRVPDGMREELEELAAEDCRPLNGELIWLLKSGIAARKAASNPVV
ncbi:Arc family DNA-binding protein [Sphingobium fuliginis]|jgi:hypothetical protein|uniref:Arc family DNA-binding protein n=1 Tax=Sphingobium fuliginis (strain ATCC 27551) TaxID=336203 RepID=UPI0037CB53AA